MLLSLLRDKNVTLALLAGDQSAGHREEGMKLAGTTQSAQSTTTQENRLPGTDSLCLRTRRWALVIVVAEAA